MVEHQEPDALEEPSAAAVAERLSWYRDWVLLLTVSAVLAVDQLSKQLIKTNFSLGESWPDEGLLRLTYGTNSGSAFGLFADQTFILILASVLAIGFLIYFYRTHALPSPLLRVAIGLLLGGALGNLIDRLRAGTVVDFIDFGWWPIFNLADSSIVVGMALLIGLLVLGYSESPPAARSKSEGLRDRVGL